jgi:hypothetical protein
MNIELAQSMSDSRSCRKVGYDNYSNGYQQNYNQIRDCNNPFSIKLRLMSSNSVCQLFL